MKAIFGVLVMVAVALVCIKLIPPYFSNYQFEDFIKNEALQSTYGSRSETDIRDSVIKDDTPDVRGMIAITTLNLPSLKSRLHAPESTAVAASRSKLTTACRSVCPVTRRRWSSALLRRTRAFTKVSANLLFARYTPVNSPGSDAIKVRVCYAIGLRRRPHGGRPCPQR